VAFNTINQSINQTFISGQRPVDCDDIDSGRSGVYTIYPKGSADPMKIFYFIQADGTIKQRSTVRFGYEYLSQFT
jgi:hypothetical protein